MFNAGIVRDGVVGLKAIATKPRLMSLNRHCRAIR